MSKVEIPLWQDLANKADHMNPSNLNPLELFVWEYEPEDRTHVKHFRKRLQGALDYVADGNR